MKHYPLLAYISAFSAVIPIFTGIFRLMSIKRGMRILLVLLCIGFATDFFLMWPYRGHQLVPWFVQAYIFLEYLLVMSIIYYWQESKKMRELFKIIIGLYIIFWIYAKFTFEPLMGPDSVTASISRVILVLSAGYTLFVVIGDRLQPLLSHQRFWVLLSFVIYYTGTLMPFALQGILSNYSSGDLMLAWSINWILMIVSNILFTKGYLCSQTQP